MLLEPNPYTLCPSCGEVYHEDDLHKCNPMLVEFQKKEWSLDTWHGLYPEIYQTVELHHIFGGKGDCPRCFLFTEQTGYEVSPNRI